MPQPDAVIEVIGAHECPLYNVGDTLELNATALSCKRKKPVCVILAGDIREVLKKYGRIDAEKRYRFDCSECGGFIKLEYRGAVSSDLGREDRPVQDVTAIVHLLSQFPFFQAMEEGNLTDIVSFLKMRRYEPGHTIINRGEEGRNLYVIVSGKVEVLAEEDVCMAHLGKGEIFGEMSLLSGEPVGATVRTLQETKLLYLEGERFRKMLGNAPSLQMYIACLLARRLAHTNVMFFDEMSAEIVGRLSEIPPTGLFQMFNLNQKTGVVRLELAGETAEIAFRDGEMVRAAYGDLEGPEAFYEVLKSTEGRFKFKPILPEADMAARPLADFMSLLMEGVRRMDEFGAGDAA